MQARLQMAEHTEKKKYHILRVMFPKMITLESSLYFSLQFMNRIISTF